MTNENKDNIIKLISIIQLFMILKDNDLYRFYLNFSYNDDPTHCHNIFGHRILVGII